MSGVLQVLSPRRLPHECTARDAAGCALCRQVLCILRKDTDVWALPGGMVRSGESVSDAVRKSIQACGDFKDGLLTSSAEVQKKKRQFDMLVDKLFSGGVPVFMVRRPTLLSQLPALSPPSPSRPGLLRRPPQHGQRVDGKQGRALPLHSGAGVTASTRG